MPGETLRIGGACGFWGESADAALAQLMGPGAGELDALVFDYLAEITLSIMARARARDPALGYATDFPKDLAPHLPEIARRGVRVVSNAGGVNPSACAAKLREIVAEAGLPLRVAVVSGDDLTPRAREFAEAREMFSDAPFPPADKVASINAYLGAFPIAEALGHAEIVITGRCADSAVTLALAIHRFGWTPDDLDRLAQGSLAGHLLECGPQATGGNFTDWEAVGGFADIGYPIAELRADGAFELTKPADTTGLVTPGTVGEQMLYEIGDPRAYLLPDVAADFTRVTLERTAPDRVRVAGAIGRPPPDTLKVSATWADGWRAGTVLFFYGEKADARARAYAEAVVERARRKLRAANAPDFTETLVEVLGDESHYGAHRRVEGSREVAVKIAAKHADSRPLAGLLKETIGLALGGPPGLTLFAGSRPKPSPVVRLFSFLAPKSEVPILVETDSAVWSAAQPEGAPFDASTLPEDAPGPADLSGPTVTVPLARLAWARSGDKGDKANVGVLPRDPAHAPWIWAALSESEVAARFAHFSPSRVEKWFMPGTGATNLLLHDVLGGGGVASLRNDPQGKGYAQLLLQAPVEIPAALLDDPE